jgi:LCP family protein required for cell wall assembly
MINPNPVFQKSSPYSNPGNSNPPVHELNLPNKLNPTKKKHPWRKAFLMVLTCVIIASATYAVAEFISVKDRIIIGHQGSKSAFLNGNLQDPNTKLDPNAFQKFDDGRLNLLIVGVGGVGHSGPYLTDTMQVISIDTINKKFTMTSVPRDLYVNIPGHGYGKINEAYEDGQQDSPNGGALLAREVVGNVLGINISNFALLDFSGAEDVVNALGGIDVNVPTAINDPFFPNDLTNGYNPFYISAGPHHMDGITALNYARSRETTTDFDRSMRQQLIIDAVKKKALTLGVLSNPARITNLINIVGDHFRTDLQSNEILFFINLFRESTQTSTQVLSTDAQQNLLTAKNYPVYISYPILGINNYTAVHQWFAKSNPDPLLTRESAKIILSSNGQATQAQLQQELTVLQDYGYNVSLDPQISTVNTKKTLIQIANTNKPITVNYLKTLFNISSVSQKSLANGADIDIIYVPSS